MTLLSKTEYANINIRIFLHHFPEAYKINILFTVWALLEGKKREGNRSPLGWKGPFAMCRHSRAPGAGLRDPSTQAHPGSP